MNFLSISVNYLFKFSAQVSNLECLFWRSNNLPAYSNIIPSLLFRLSGFTVYYLFLLKFWQIFENFSTFMASASLQIIWPHYVTEFFSLCLLAPNISVIKLRRVSTVKIKAKTGFFSLYILDKGCTCISRVVWVKILVQKAGQHLYIALRAHQANYKWRQKNYVNYLGIHEYYDLGGSVPSIFWNR